MAEAKTALEKMVELNTETLELLDIRLQKLERVKEHSLSGRMALDDQVAKLRTRAEAFEWYLKAQKKLIEKILEEKTIL